MIVKSTLVDLVAWPLWVLQRLACDESEANVESLQRTNGKCGEWISSVIEKELSKPDLRQLVAGVHSLTGDVSKVPPGCDIPSTLELYAKTGEGMHKWIGEEIQPAEKASALAVGAAVAIMYVTVLKEIDGYKTNNWSEAIANDRLVCKWLTQYLGRHATKDELAQLANELDEQSRVSHACNETSLTMFAHRDLLVADEAS